LLTLCLPLAYPLLTPCLPLDSDLRRHFKRPCGLSAKHHVAVAGVITPLIRGRHH
jgi:hypothetical protein